MNPVIHKMYCRVLAESAERWNVPDAKKFSELIVRECIGIIDELLVDCNEDGTWTSNELYTDYNGALFEVKRRIEEHLGVK
jgi:hypothetical protein